MTLDQLRIFVAVAEQEHVTRAAQQLNLTQSATSAAIAALEERYAAKLFDRIGRNIRLTAMGREFLTEARAVLARASAAETVLADFAGLKRGSLSLAASQTAGNYWLPPLIWHFQQRHPGIVFHLDIGNTEQVARHVLEGRADIGFVEGEVDEPTLSIQTVTEDDLALVVSPDHPRATRRPIKRSDLKEIAWVLREQGSGTRAALESTLARFKLGPKDINVAIELPSNESVRTAVAAGAGATLMSKLVAAAMLKSNQLIELDLQLPPRRFYALRHKERHFSRAEREFLEMITSGSASRRPDQRKLNASENTR